MALTTKYYIVMAAALSLLLAGAIGFRLLTQYEARQSLDPHKLEVLKALLRASNRTLATFDLDRAAHNGPGDRKSRTCMEAARLWGDYARRCLQGSAQQRRRLSQQVMQLAESTYRCGDRSIVRDERSLQSCFDFLRNGPCSVLDHPEEMALDRPSLLIYSKKRPQPHRHCIEAF